MVDKPKKKTSKPKRTVNIVKKTTKKPAGKKTQKKKKKSRSQEGQQRNRPPRQGFSNKPDSKKRRRPGKRPLKSNPDRVRIIPLGGVEEVGRNMTVIEVGDDIFVADVGFEFTDEAEAPGVNFILPNTAYLEARKSKIKGVFITHGHLDHIGGIPFIMDKIGNPPLYTLKLTAKLIQKRQEDFPSKPKLKIITTVPGERLKISNTYVSTFTVTHSIPDSVGLKFETPQGNVVISGDLKLDHVQGEPTEAEEELFSALGEEDNLFFMCDSTNAERPGFSITEREVADNISAIIRRTKGRIFIGTFASQLARIIDIMQVCHETGRKVILEGRSIVNNVEIARQLGMFNLPRDIVIEAKEMNKYLPSQILILATGAQGEEFAALRRIATDTHRHIKLNKKDTILLASSVIPGNERAVQSLRDLLILSGLEIITYRTSDVHSTGHGNIGELLWINDKIGAKYFMPGYGYRTMTYAHAEALVDHGFPEENIVVAENGTIVDFFDGEMKVNKEKLDMGLVVVDGKFNGELQAGILPERKVLGEHGIFVLVFQVNSAKKPKLQGPPEILSRGAAMPSHPANFVKGIMRIAQNQLDSTPLGKGGRKFDRVKELLIGRMQDYIEKQTEKKPLIDVIVVENR